MSSVRREILSLSEKYSLKCMEAAQLEEQLSSSSRQVQQSQQIISELDNRYQPRIYNIFEEISKTKIVSGTSNCATRCCPTQETLLPRALAAQCPTRSCCSL